VQVLLKRLRHPSLAPVGDRGEVPQAWARFGPGHLATGTEVDVPIRVQHDPAVLAGGPVFVQALYVPPLVSDLVTARVQ
jgi:hypothetical protein